MKFLSYVDSENEGSVEQRDKVQQPHVSAWYLYNAKGIWHQSI